ncbi:MAG TPA: MarR family transcriptional regulator [Jatrophihabitans sp.]|nr:MarR family transcriptional regulator [Jatrophihabitans sp.]
MVDSIVRELQRATHVVLEALEGELAGLKLRASEINVLANLADGEPRPVSRLAAEVGSRPTTMTTVLDRLAARALIRRTANPDDRRSLLIELTPAGRRTARRVRSAVDRVEEQAVAGLSPHAVAALRRGLAALGGSHDPLRGAHDPLRGGHA